MQDLQISTIWTKEDKKECGLIKSKCETNIGYVGKTFSFDLYTFMEISLHQTLKLF